MSYVNKYLLRTKIKSLLCIILLACTQIFLCLSISLLISSHDTKSKTSEVFTTIALPDMVKIRDLANIDVYTDAGQLNTEDDYIGFFNVQSLIKELILKVDSYNLPNPYGKKDNYYSFYAYSPKSEKVMTFNHMKKQNGDSVFEIGKRYIVFGRYAYSDEKISTLNIMNTSSSIGSVIYEGDIRHYIEVDDDISIDDFLNKKENEIWKEYLENSKMIISSVNIVTTDRLESIPFFNRKKTRIISGRVFTKKDYEEGNKVCIVSSLIAEKNNIKVGDILPLFFYDVDYHIESNYNTTIQKPEIFPDNLNIFDEGEYEVIGIYQSPEYEQSTYMIAPNTVYIPFHSLTAAKVGDKLEKRRIQSTYIVDNGYMKEFLESIQDEELKDLFMFFDQGYSYVHEMIKSMYDNSLMIFCISLFVFAGVVYSVTLIFSENRTSKAYIYGFWCPID